VRDLLTKKLRYSQSQAVTGVKARVDLWRTYCPSCGFTIYLFGVVDLQAKSECGAAITLGHNRYSLLYPDSYSAFLDQYVQGILESYMNSSTFRDRGPTVSRVRVRRLREDAYCRPTRRP